MLKTKQPKKPLKKIQIRKTTKQKSPTDEKQDSNLCSTCNHNGNCTLSSTSSTIYHCEEFDDSIAIQKQSIAPERNEEKNQLPNEQYMGLCVNCAHRDTCSLSRMEGGVWHCEEYE